MIPISPRLILAGLALSIAGLALWAGYNWAHGRGTASERARWEEATRQAGERFSEALAAQQATLEQTESALAKARRAANQRREDISDAIQSDPAARDWAGEPIPSRMRHALGDSSVPADTAQPDDALRP